MYKKQHIEPLLQLQEQPRAAWRAPPPLPPPPPPPPPLPLPYPGTPRGLPPLPSAPPAVFLSHKWEQKPLVARLARCLAAAGVSYWLDTEQMAAGGSLLDKITQGVHGCSVVLVVLSREYLGSENCHTELQLARSYKKPLVVVKLPGVDCPPAPSAGTYAAAMAGVVAGELWLGVDVEAPVPEQELLKALEGKGVAVQWGARVRE